MKCLNITTPNIEEFQNKLIAFSASQDNACILNSNYFPSDIPGIANHSSFNFIAAFANNESEKTDSFEKLSENNKNWLFGHFSYDTKNQIEKLFSKHPDYIGFSDIHFFRPRFVFKITNNIAEVWYTDKDHSETIALLIKQIQETEIKNSENKPIQISSRFEKEEFIRSIKKIKQHIQAGDIYELNFCQEFYAENTIIDPASLYIKLCKLSPAPFSCFYKEGNKYLLSASPERFLKKSGNKIISQPMKGTSAKGKNEIENSLIKNDLMNNEKERAENIMIVDLVRNDLSRKAILNSIKVEELCGIYEFPQVFQMISTIGAEISDNTDFSEVIRCSFPMGSMTGAPKIKAMELIEQYEKTKRGLYSGSVGYFDPNGDFDFNVIIRSIQYNSENRYLSFQTGGAITIQSDPLLEYEECLIKAKGILLALNGKLKAIS